MFKGQSQPRSVWVCHECVQVCVCVYVCVFGIVLKRRGASPGLNS